jgi:hypothetical protein
MWMGVLTSVLLQNWFGASKHFDPFLHISVRQRVLLTAGGHLSVELSLFRFFKHQNLHSCMLFLFGADLLEFCAKVTLRHAHLTQTEHCRSVPPSDFQLQHDHTSALLRIIQQKYYNIADILSVSLICR